MFNIACALKSKVFSLFLGGLDNNFNPSISGH